jgi:hypothetical protein
MAVIRRHAAQNSHVAHIFIKVVTLESNLAMLMLSVHLAFAPKISVAKGKLVKLVFQIVALVGDRRLNPRIVKRRDAIKRRAARS